MRSKRTRGNVYSASCPSRSVLETIASKWALLIVPLLVERPIRNNEFLRLIDGISQKMLTQTLRELERNGLVERIDHQTVPPHVEYRITPMGRSLNQVLAPVDDWAEAHFQKLLSAREGFDQRSR
ncbi:helix-turn-helix transcriptional regulator [Xanthomonas sp. H13-6]|uniref:Helix-turn-helix transcriptional regulator n=1 Tax=Xanthomonas chitinilytica TaxID=2989819 RepID=A0ABT3JZI2_9XANT|nr:helix-turn-helix domain-containing protein [Xanthomonas sp. H13-6]MCW4473629.1 helix-turn-helix transcriptional regulator [Xanthomonas sp. H13-6]